MHRLSLHLFCLTVALAMLAGGCVISEQPLSARADAKPDPRLAGKWIVKKDANPSEDVTAVVESGRVTFDADGTGHLDAFKDGESVNEPMTFFITRTPHGSYLNLIFGGSSKDAKEAKAAGSIIGKNVSYEFARYQISDDGKTLQWSFLKRDRLKDALVAGQLKGKLLENEQTSTDESPGQPPKTETRPEKEIPLNDKEAVAKANFYWVLLNDTSENILKFIESTPEKEMFDDPTTLKKAD